MDRIDIQARALLMMKRYGEVEWKDGLHGKRILHSVPQPRQDNENIKRTMIPQREIEHGFD